jgi:hypothetical protein
MRLRKFHIEIFHKRITENPDICAQLSNFLCNSSNHDASLTSITD